ncbi:MAG TPA: Na/Pi symporter [Chitinophagales bacterium]|nr:Na/Pi symporter [Chitinophagales bacterium]
MKILLPVFQMLAGIGMFLFAMYLLEESLKNLSGRKFKLFLQRITKNRFSAVAGGAVVTAVLQSSSMVSLMVLAFVGAGVFSLENALSVILGANLGTTLTGWLVATLGFKVSIEVAAYPAVFAGGVLLIVLGNRKSVKYLSYFLIGFGLVFIGLSFMKTAMESQVKEFDFARYANMSLAVFLLIGFIVTTLVQSSSVTMALTLSALHAGAIGFPAGAAIVLGSETGTTIKILVSAVGGNVSKKRVALGTFLFNLSLTAVAFALLKPILHTITGILNISDPLIGLVTFSTFTNILTIVIFLPILTPFAKFLERFFKSTDATVAAFIGHANVAEPETALDLFRRETEYFMHNAMLFNLELFGIDTRMQQEISVFKDINVKRKFFSKPAEEKYVFLKELQGELQVFYLELRARLQDAQGPQLNQYISSVRSTMYAVKCIKDIGSNISNLSNSSKDIKFNFFISHKKETEEFYLLLNRYMQQRENVDLKSLRAAYDIVLANYSSALNNFYKEATNAPVEDLDITMAINFNRELFTSNKAMLMAVKDFLLNEQEAKEFNEIPGYMT